MKDIVAEKNSSSAKDRTKAVKEVWMKQLSKKVLQESDLQYTKVSEGSDQER